jgi:hypothetical protein
VTERRAWHRERLKVTAARTGNWHYDPQWGRTALELQGFSHYLGPGGLQEVHLYVIYFCYANTLKATRTIRPSRWMASYG